MAGKISEYPVKTTYNDGDLLDISTNGNVSEKATYLELRDDLKNYFHAQEGNSYAGDLVVGTNDNQDVVLERNNIEVIRLDDNLNAKFANGTQTGIVTGNAQDVFIATSYVNSPFNYNAGEYNEVGLPCTKANVLSINVLIGGIDSLFYPPNHTYTANSFYNILIDESGGLASVVITSAVTETNFVEGEIRIIVTYQV